nr:MAG TPA: cAMP-regulated phosphoprotein-like protein [Caudoviricetes sp.]
MRGGDWAMAKDRQPQRREVVTGSRKPRSL